MSANPSDLVTDSSNQSVEVSTQTTVSPPAWFGAIEARLIQEIDKIIESIAKDCIDHKVERQRWENVRSIVLQTDYYDLPSNIRDDTMFLFKGLIYRLYQTLKSNNDEIVKFIRPACRFYEVNLDLIIKKFEAMTDRDKKLANAAGKVVVMHQLGYTEGQIVEYTKWLIHSINNEIDLTQFEGQDISEKLDYDNGAEFFDELFGKALAEKLQESLPTLLSPQEQQALDSGEVVDKTYNGKQMSDLSQFERMSRIKSYVKKNGSFDRLSPEAKADTIYQFDLMVNTMRTILLEDNSQEFINGFVERASTVTNRDVKVALDKIESMSEEQTFLNAVREGVVSLQQLGQSEHIEAYKRHMVNETNRDLTTGKLLSTEDTNVRAVVKCLQQLKAVLKASNRIKAFDRFVDIVDAAVLTGAEIRDLVCIKKIFVEAMVNGTYNDAQLEKMIDVYINKYSQSQPKVTTPTVTPGPNPPVVVTPKTTSVTTPTSKPASVTPTVTAKIKSTSNRTKVKTFTGTKRRRVDTQPPVYQQPPTFQQPPVYQQPPTFQQPPVCQQPPTFQQPPVYQQLPTFQQPPVYQQPPMYQQPPVYAQQHQQQQVRYVPQIVGYVPIYAPSRL